MPAQPIAANLQFLNLSREEKVVETVAVKCLLFFNRHLGTEQGISDEDDRQGLIT